MTIAHRMILDIFNAFIYVLVDSALQKESAEIVQIHTNACFLSTKLCMTKNRTNTL
jgi:hypothetical protein